MGNSVKNPDFFKKPVKESSNPAGQDTKRRTAKPAPAASQKQENSFSVDKFSPTVRECRETLKSYLTENKMKSLLGELNKLDHDFERKFFTVAVVGEFSRGKSTLLNQMFDGDFLPTGNLPTTAILTKLRYNKSDMLAVFDKKGNRRSCLPLQDATWDGLTADLDGNDPDLIAVVGLNDDWLKRTGIELEDMPGAGDLYGSRAALVDEALLSDDGAIIVLSATQPLSSSERLYIEQRLLSKKIPFLMVAISKLDQVSLKERPVIVEYIRKKLKDFGEDIPVYLPYDVEMPDDSYSDIMGMDKLKAQMEAWKNSQDRRKLLEKAYLARLADIADMALDALEQQRQIVMADEQKRAQIVADKKSKIEEEGLIWEELRIGMMERSEDCKRELEKQVSDGCERIKERIQLQVSHSPDVSKWMKTDYPYYFKSELMNLMSQIDNSISRIIISDTKWLNEELARRYKVQVVVERQVIADKEQAKDIQPNDDVKLSNLSMQRNIARVATTGASIAGYAALMSVGMLPIIATMGISTGASIFTESFFKKRLEDQRKQVSLEIAKETDKLGEQLISESRPKVDSTYNNINDSERKREEVWSRAQNEAIENSIRVEDKDAKQKLEGSKEALEALRSRILA